MVRLRAEARAGVNHPAEARKAFHGGTSTCRGPVAQETELTAHVAGRRGLRAREQESWPGQQGRWWAQAVWTLPCRRRLTRECQEGILASPAPAAVCGSAQGASGLNHEDRGPTAGGTAEPTKGAGALFLEQELFGFQHATSRMMQPVCLPRNQCTQDRGSERLRASQPASPLPSAQHPHVALPTTQPALG